MVLLLRRLSANTRMMLWVSRPTPANVPATMTTMEAVEGEVVMVPRGMEEGAGEDITVVEVGEDTMAVEVGEDTMEEEEEVVVVDTGGEISDKCFLCV